jgi:hypothetical protein
LLDGDAGPAKHTDEAIVMINLADDGVLKKYIEHAIELSGDADDG